MVAVGQKDDDDDDDDDNDDDDGAEPFCADFGILKEKAARDNPPLQVLPARYLATPCKEKNHQRSENPDEREMGFLALVPIRGLKIVGIMGFLGLIVEMMGFLGSGPIMAPQDLGFLVLPFSNHLVINKHIQICKK